MEMRTRLDDLLEQGRFDEARELLQNNLLSGDVLDPRTDKHWAPIADSIAFRIERDGGEATIGFWGALLAFFVEKIEPVWGHAHKGHLYLRVGLAYVSSDLEKAKSALDSAIGEDLILQGTKAAAEVPELRVRSSTPYVARTILEAVDESWMESHDEKLAFWRDLFVSLDAALQRRDVDAGAVEMALDTIAGVESSSRCIDLYRELRLVASQAMPFTTVSMTGTVLEALLVGSLHYGRGISTLPSGKEILRAELGQLMREAIRLGIFPNQAVAAVFRLVHLFRNRLHPGNEIGQSYPLTPRVAITVKVFFELGVLQWWQPGPLGDLVWARRC